MKKLYFILVFMTLLVISSCTSVSSKDTSIVTTTTPTTVVPTITLPNSTAPTIQSTIISTATSTEEIDNSYVFASPDGNGDGSYNNPCSLEYGISNLSTEKTLYLLGGTYNVSSVIRLTSKGDKDSYYKIYAYNNEKVVLDFGVDYSKNPEPTGEYNKEVSRGIVIKGSYYHVKGITITNCRAHGLLISGSYNIVENCVFARNGNTGCDIGGASNMAIEDRPHDNLIKNCTSYGNYDWDRETSKGEDADGFGCKLTSGINNVFDGCIAYNNSDDGWDLFTKHLTGAIGSVTIINSVAFSNGYSMTGENMMNGNGFKLGGRAIEVDHFVDNCIAFKNKSNGFDDNSNPGTITLSNCTAYQNGSRNYAMGRFLNETNTYKSQWYEDDILMGPIENVPKSHNIFTNCISYSGGNADTYSGIATNSCFYKASQDFYKFTDSAQCNSSNSLGTRVASISPFESYTIDLQDLENIHYKYRNEDYSINLNSFLKVKEEYTFGAKLHEKSK